MKNTTLPGDWRIRITLTTEPLTLDQMESIIEGLPPHSGVLIDKSSNNAEITPASQAHTPEAAFSDALYHVMAVVNEIVGKACPFVKGTIEPVLEEDIAEAQAFFDNLPTTGVA
jgi:hypothetical protein